VGLADISGRFSFSLLDGTGQAPSVDIEAGNPGFTTSLRVR